MDKNKDLLLKLAKAENEDEVESILKEEYAKSLNWYPFNGDSSNFATINNQQTDSIAALAEKPINSIDAVLTKECLLKGVNPAGESAPRGMYEAVESFFSVKEGDISNLGTRERRELADNILIIADGEKERPNITIVDFGEGQNPEDFKNTLLSLHRKNKARIPFVQGKYGMGGTGVLPFCGSKKYQLILSRRHPKLLKKGQRDLWGFSLVRKTPAEKLDERDKHSWFECLVDSQKNILTFETEGLYILPEWGKMSYGSFIKLFNYDLPRASFATADLWRDLNRRLYSPALPILIQETREKYFTITKGKNDTKVLIGNKHRIGKDDRNFVRESFPITADLKDFGERKIDVVIFKDFDKKGNPLRKGQEWATAQESVFFTINGQTHYALPRYWLKKTNLDFLVDYLFVHLDCTSVNRTVADDIFFGSRDRVRDNAAFREVQEKLLFALGSNEVLEKLNEEYKERKLSSIRPDKSIAKKLVANMITKNKDLMNYFTRGAEVPLTMEGGDTEEVPESFEGSYIPTFLKPRKKFDGPVLVKEIHENSPHAIVLLDTDAQNDYFSRRNDSGEFMWNSSDSRARVIVRYLFNGMLPVRVSVENAREGEQFDYSVQLTRPNASPLVVNFKLKVLGEKERRAGGRVEREPEQMGINLPLLQTVEKEGWKDRRWDGATGWTAESIAEVSPGVIYVNMDSSDLRNFLTQCPIRLRAFAETIYKVGIFLNSIVVDLELKKLDSPDQEKLFARAISAVSKTLLPLQLEPKIQKLGEEE